MPDLYLLGVGALFVAAALVFPALWRRPAPYGRHDREGFGPAVPARAAWLVMELPAAVVFALVFFGGAHSTSRVALLLLALWQLHYLQRSLLYPLRMRGRGRTMPLVVALSAFAFNCVNASLNAYAVAHRGTSEGSAGLADPRLLLGAALFLGGYALNLHSDAMLRKLRRPGEQGYRIPRGGLFRWVSCPNYLGEIVEWCGWALASRSGAGLAFAVFTVANLAPRARAHHHWYRATFPEYPPRRRALLPGLW